MKYAIVVAKADGRFRAIVPDLPGCFATGATVEAAKSEIREAIAYHIESLREDGLPIPQSTSGVYYVDVAA
jgi:predicted RNase H-like HicB family nuclease